MTFIAAGLGGISNFINNRFSKELDAQSIKSQLNNFSYTAQSLIFTEANADNLKNLLPDLLTQPNSNFSKSLTPLISDFLDSFIENRRQENKTYDTDKEAFTDFKLEFNQLIRDMLNKVFENSANNPKATVQKQRFDESLERFWSSSENQLLSSNTGKLNPLIKIALALPDPLPAADVTSINNPAALNVNSQIHSLGNQAPPPPSFNPSDINDLISLSSNTLPETFLAVNIPHAQLREYTQAYGDLIDAALNSDVLKLAVNSVNPGLRLDVRTEAIPALELFIQKCIEADGIRLSEAAATDVSKIKTLIHSSDVQENLNTVLKEWGLEYDFKELKLNTKSFTEALVNLDDLIQMQSTSFASPRLEEASLNISNSHEFADLVEKVVDRKNSSIKNISLLNYGEDLMQLLSGSDFRDLLTESNRADLSIEIPYSEQAFKLIKNLKAIQLENDAEKLMPEFKFIYPSLDSTPIADLRGLIKDKAPRSDSELDSDLAFKTYVTKTHEERGRIENLLLGTKADGGYGLSPSKGSEKAYINLLLDFIAPAQVQSLNDVYDRDEYQKKITESFRLAFINNPNQLAGVKNSILAQIHTARSIESNFREEDNLPKIADLLEKSLFAAKPDTDSKKYNSLDYFYWIEQGLAHTELVRDLANTTKIASLGTSLNEDKANRLLNSYLDIALTKDEKTKNKKLSMLIADGFSAAIVLEKFKIIDIALGEKYSDYLSQNLDYAEAKRTPLSSLSFLEDLQRNPIQQMNLFVAREIEVLKSNATQSSPLDKITDATINLYKALRESSASNLKDLLVKPLLNLNDEDLAKSMGSMDKLIQDFKTLDTLLIPVLKDNYPHLDAIINPLLQEKAAKWTEEESNLEGALASYKTLTRGNLLKYTQKAVGKMLTTESLTYLNKFNTNSSALDTNIGELRLMIKDAFLDTKIQNSASFDTNLDNKAQRLAVMQQEILGAVYSRLGDTQFNLIKDLLAISNDQRQSLVTLKDSLKAPLEGAEGLMSFFREINLETNDLIKLGVKAEQASLEALARYLSYQGTDGLDTLRNDMKLRYKSLTEKDDLSHAVAIQKVQQEFTELLAAYDNSQLADRVWITKNINLDKLAETPLLRDFSLEAGSLNPTNILNKQRIDNFIESNSHFLADGTVMLALANPSETQSREYIHLSAEEYKNFSETMANYLKEGINLNQSNISRDEPIIYPSVPKILDNSGLEINSAASENSSRILLLTKPEFKFQGTNFIQSGSLLLPKAALADDLTEGNQTKSDLLTKDFIDLGKNTFKIYTLNSADKPSHLEDFTLTTQSATNLNLGDYARDLINELSVRNHREKEEQQLISKTFRSLQVANNEDISSRFLSYEKEHGDLPVNYKAPVYNNLFLKALEINQANPSQAAESLIKTFDSLLSKQNTSEQQKNKFLEGIKVMFELLENVYLDLFANLDKDSGDKLGRGKIEPLMTNPELKAYFKKHETAGILTL